MIIVMRYLFLAAFIIATAVHLYASFYEKAKLRSATKPFILLTLLGFYVTASRAFSISIVLALLFSWIGDVLLIHKGIKWFTAGGISFIISHVFLILGYCMDLDFGEIPLALILIMPLLALSVVTFIFSKLKRYIPKVLIYPMFLYLLTNGAMNCYAIFRCVSRISAATIITMLGAALFFASDTILFIVKFKKNSRLNTHFPVMLTYSLGLFMIVLGQL